MTNDLISRKDLLGMFENRKWFFTSDIINSINFRPAVSGEPVVWMKVNETTGEKYFITTPNPAFGYDVFPLYLAPPDQTARINELEVRLGDVTQAYQEKLNERDEKIAELEKQNEKYRSALTEIWTDSMVDSWQCKLAESVLSEEK